MQIKATAIQCQDLLAARSLTGYTKKNRRKAIWADIRRTTGVTTKFVLFVQSPTNPLYGVLRDARTKMPLDDGRPDLALTAATVETLKPVATQVEALKPVAKKSAPAKKVAAKAPAKKVAAKAPAKKVAAKAPAKKVAAKAPAKKATPAKAPAKAPAKKATPKAVAKPVKPAAKKATGAKAPAKAAKPATKARKA